MHGDHVSIAIGTYLLMAVCLSLWCYITGEAKSCGCHADMLAAHPVHAEDTRGLSATRIIGNRGKVVSAPAVTSPNKAGNNSHKEY